VSLLSKAIEKNPDSIAAYNDRNMAYEMLGKTKEAEEDRRMMNIVKRRVVWKKF